MLIAALTLIDKAQGDSDIIFADLDHDGDGKINFEDFRSVWRSISNLKKWLSGPLVSNQLYKSPC